MGWQQGNILHKLIKKVKLRDLLIEGSHVHHVMIELNLSLWLREKNYQLKIRRHREKMVDAHAAAAVGSSSVRGMDVFLNEMSK